MLRFEAFHRAFVTLAPRYRHPRECGGLVLIFILGFLDSRLRGNDGGGRPIVALVTLAPRFRYARECGGLVLIFILGFLDSTPTRE